MLGPTLVVAAASCGTDVRGRLAREDLRDAMTAAGEHLMHHGLVATAIGVRRRAGRPAG